MLKWIRKVKQIFSKSPGITFENITDNINITISIGDPVKNRGAGSVTLVTHSGGGFGSGACGGHGGSSSKIMDGAGAGGRNEISEDKRGPL